MDGKKSEKIVYVEPNYEYGLEELQDPNNFNELLKTGKDKGIHIYDTMDDFMEAFNNGYISEDGYLMRKPE